MPSLPAKGNARVLVTGGNGFIAAHVIKILLERTKYDVVATARDAQKAKKIQQVHGYSSRLFTQLVPDITAHDAFLDAVEGCHAIIHLASPFGYAYSDFEKELLVPSIEGTKSICNAASHAKSVQRMIFASSFASVYDASPEGMAPTKVYTEKDWSPLTYEDGKTAAATPIAYRASKVLAEQVAWRLCAEQSRWDMVSLCPGMVLGPLVEGTLANLKELNTSNGIVWGLVDKTSVPETRAPLWTSVTSLAEASLSALTSDEVSLERLLLLNGYFDNQELCDIIHSSDTLDTEIKKRVPIGDPGQRPSKSFYKADWRKSEDLLSYEKPTLKNTVEDLMAQLVHIEATQSSTVTNGIHSNGVNGAH